MSISIYSIFLVLIFFSIQSASAESLASESERIFLAQNAYLKAQYNLDDQEMDEAESTSSEFEDNREDIEAFTEESSVWIRENLMLEIKLNGGYRIDKLKWNIASDASGTSVPNILSELRWKSLKIAQFSGEGKITVADRALVELKGSYGKIFDGKVTDSDFAFNNRNGEFLRSTAENNDDDVWDFSSGVGLNFQLKALAKHLEARVIKLSILAGYSFHEQNLRMTNGELTVNEFGPFVGDFPGLRSTYETEWDGPWFGFELHGIRDRLTPYVRFELHLVDYDAVANWNLREDFQHPKSFVQSGDGTGITLGLGLKYEWSEHWEFSLDGSYNDFEIEDGKDRTFFSDGQVLETKLNEVNWRSFTISLGVSYRF